MLVALEIHQYHGPPTQTQSIEMLHHKESGEKLHHEVCIYLLDFSPSFILFLSSQLAVHSKS